MSKINIVKGTKDHQDVLFNLSKEFEEYNASTSKDTTGKFFADDWQNYFREEILESIEDADSYNFIAYVDDEPVGYIYSYYCNKCFYYAISELYVKDSARGLKLGKMLMDLAVAEGKKYECPIRLEVFLWNTDAIKFYERYGFVQDAVVMELP